jgi:formamidopyrimidine-DNA glycosylase
MLPSQHMPELPEVQTTVDGINLVAQGRIITDVWTDMFSVSTRGKDSIKNKDYFQTVFRPTVIHKKILHAVRRAKNILIHLSENETILIHMKMTGHVMYGKYVHYTKENTWLPQKGQPSLEDKFNRFIHVVFTLDNGCHLVLCDMRKFAKVTLVTDDIQKELSALGPEPLNATHTAQEFASNIQQHPHTYIKTALLDQTIVAGIGNIYSDEILHAAKILPDRKVSSLSPKELKTIHSHIAPILRAGIDMGGDSMSDYRNIHGERGLFQGKHKAYRRTGLPCVCRGCSGTIERKVINSRSAHFCRTCQK